MKKTAPQKKVSKVMKEFKAGTLHSGKGGKVVKNPKQAVAIALSEAGKAKPKKMAVGGMMPMGTDRAALPTRQAPPATMNMQQRSEALRKLAAQKNAALEAASKTKDREAARSARLSYWDQRRAVEEQRAAGREQEKIARSEARVAKGKTPSYVAGTYGASKAKIGVTGGGKPAPATPAGVTGGVPRTTISGVPQTTISRNISPEMILQTPPLGAAKGGLMNKKTIKPAAKTKAKAKPAVKKKK